MKKIKYLFLLLIMFCTSCISKSNLAYFDKTIIQEGDITVTFCNFENRINSNYFSFNIELLSNNPKQQKIKVSDYMVYRESDKAEYTASSYKLEEEIILSCDIVEKISFSCQLPTSPSEDKYYFNIKLNNNKYRFNFYEREDKDKEEYSLKYIVDGETVRETKMLSFNIVEGIEWISDDYSYYCIEWYLDEKCENKLNDKTRIKENMNLYGKKEDIIYYYSNTGGNYTASTVKYVPKSKVLVIPKEFEGKKVTVLGAGLFPSYGDLDIDKLYISKNITSIYQYNTFKGVKSIYFEGDNATWNEIFKGKLDPGVRVYYNQNYNNDIDIIE